MAYETTANVSMAPAHSSGVLAGCLRALADMAERHHRRAAQRHELAHLSDALKRDIGLAAAPRRSGHTLPPAMNGRFQLGL